jgi:hypothetical protein
MSSPSLPSLRFVLTGLLSLVAPLAAAAMGLQSNVADRMPTAPIPPTPGAMVIDGSLQEWQPVAGLHYNPLAYLGKSGGDAAVAALLTHPTAVDFKTCYDDDALYLAVNWQDQQPGVNSTPAGDAAHWSAGGEGFAIHLLTDRVVHLACWPVQGARSLAVMARYDNETEWHDVSAQVQAAGKLGADGQTYAQELRVPWSAITRTGRLPADGHVELGVDFSWNALPAASIPDVRKGLEASGNFAPGISVDFVTSPSATVISGYLGNPGSWGKLVLGETPTKDEAVAAPNGSTSLGSFSIARAGTPPAIDGTLNGWDPASFQTASYLGALWKDRFTCRLAAQYDADNLYLAAHFAAPGPTNLKPESSTQGYAGGDALQIRLSDGAKKVNLCGWFDSTGKPALTCDGNDLPNPFLLRQGAREAFASDGQGGYVQTMAIPWSVLFGNAPADGGKLAGTFQMWFADTTPIFSYHGATTLEKRPALSLAFTMPASGHVTLGLFDREGRLLRWLTRDAAYAKGPQHAPWDGLDQYGQPVAPGSYTLKALYHQPLATEYKMTADNPGHPAWPTPDDHGDWLGDESNPQAAATDGKWVFLASPDCEKGYSIIAVDENGQRQWGYQEPASPRTVSLAVSGDYLYALYAGPVGTKEDRTFIDTKDTIGRGILVCLDKHTGQPARFTQENPQLRVLSWPYRQQVSWLWDLRNAKGFSPATYAGQPRYAANDIGETTDALGIAATADKLYVSLFYDDKIVELDAATGQPTGVEYPVTAPAGLTLADPETLLVVSGKQIVKIDLASKAVTPVVTSQLEAPFCVTTDPAGTIYVADWASSFQVKAFGPDGHFQRAIGKAGGRPWSGVFDKSGMLVPHGIAVTDDGKLWVAEDDSSPKRVSVWNSQTGSLIRDYIGPTPYGAQTYFWIDPKDPTQLFSSHTRFKIDLAAKTYTPEATVFRKQSRDDVFTPSGGSGGTAQVLYHGGHQYVAVGTFTTCSILERQGDVFRPVAAIGSRGRDPDPLFNLDGTSVPVWDSDLGHHLYRGYFPDFFQDKIGYNYSWTDQNGDHLVQADEMTWVQAQRGTAAQGHQPILRTTWGTALASNWSFFTQGEFNDQTAIFRLDPKGWTAAGAPIYDVADARPIAFVPRGSDIEGLFVTRDNKLIVTFTYEVWGKSKNAFSAYDLDGHFLWSIARPERLEGDQPHATNAVYDFKIPGLGDIFGTWAWHGSYRPYLISSDGLYVGTLLDNTLLGPTALWGESLAYYYQSPEDGTPYIINGINQSENLLAIRGLEGGRFSRSYELTPADAAKAAADRPVAGSAGGTAKTPLLLATLAQPPAIDGDLSDWNLDQGVLFQGSANRGAQVALARDDKNLYLAYRVHESNPLRNGGTNWQTLFLSGDCVDLMLQTDPHADPQRPGAATGDERLLFSVFQGKPIAVLYRPKVPGVAQPVRLAAASIDQITRLDSARIAVKRDPVNGSYTLEAQVPLADLGLNPGSGDLRGDVGVIFADESGRNRALRLYYYNQQTQMVNDLTTEATLQPSQWGRIVPAR